jgi:hypothetical protein
MSQGRLTASNHERREPRYLRWSLARSAIYVCIRRRRDRALRCQHDRNPGASPKSSRRRHVTTQPFTTCPAMSAHSLNSRCEGRRL